MKTQKYRQRGFTLIEALLAVALIAILMTLGVPAFTTVIKDQQLSSASTGLLSAMARARSEAVKRNARVVICIVDPASTACDASGTWNQGWMVYVDGDRDFNYTLPDNCSSTTADCALYLERGVSAVISIDHDDEFIAYNGTGAPDSIVSFLVCDNRKDGLQANGWRDPPAKYGREITIAASGRPTIHTFEDRGRGDVDPYYVHGCDL